MGARTGLVTGRTTGKNRNRGTDVRLMQTVITDQDDVQTVQLVEQSGEESNPLTGSMVVLIPGANAAKLGIAVEDGITPIMAVGGKRIYSIDPSTQQVAAEVKLDPDGTVTVSNSAASFTMNPDGTFVFSGVSTAFDHPITATEVTAGGVALTTHAHTGVTTGGSNTGGPV